MLQLWKLQSMFEYCECRIDEFIAGKVMGGKGPLPDGIFNEEFTIFLNLEVTGGLR